MSRATKKARLEGPEGFAASFLSGPDFKKGIFQMEIALGFITYIVGCILAIRWLSLRWDPRRRAVYDLFRSYRREFKSRERACEKYVNQRIEHYRRPF